MSYATQNSAQQWLNRTKYTITGIDEELDQVAADTVITLLARRYDTTLWVDTGSTPDMAVNLINMLYAAYWLRRNTSEDDGAATYSDWLEGRVNGLLAGLSTGLINIPGADPSSSTADVGVPVFWPTQDATDLYFQDPQAEGAAARAFDMQKVF